MGNSVSGYENGCYCKKQCICYKCEYINVDKRYLKWEYVNPEEKQKIINIVKEHFTKQYNPNSVIIRIPGVVYYFERNRWEPDIVVLMSHAVKEYLNNNNIYKPYTISDNGVSTIISFIQNQ